MYLTEFPKISQTQGTLRSLSWTEICNTSHILSPDKDTRLWSFKTYTNNIRQGEGITYTALVFDFDNSIEKERIPEPITFSDIEPEISSYCYLAYSTHSNTPDWPKWRLIVPLPEGQYFTKETFVRAYWEFWQAIGSPAGLDHSMVNNLNIAVYMPACPPWRKAAAWRKFNARGEYFDFTFPPLGVMAKRNGLGVAAAAAGGLGAAAGRNNKLVTMVTAGWVKRKPPKDIAQEIYVYDRDYHTPPLFSDPSEPQQRRHAPQDNALRFVMSVIKSIAGKVPQEEEPLPLPPPAAAPPSPAAAPTPATPLPAPADPDLTLPTDFLLSAPGLVGRIANWLVDNATLPQPAYAVGAALGFVGVLKSHAVRVLPNIYTNLLIANIGRTSSGKNWAFDGIQKIARASGCMSLIGRRPASGSGLEDMLAQQKGRAFCEWDELGEFFERMIGDKASSWQQDIPGTIMRIWSSCGKIYKSRAISALSEKTLPDIDCPHLCVLGASTPSQLYGALSSRQVISGFLPRWIFFASPSSFPTKNWDFKDDVPTDISAQVERMHRENHCTGQWRYRIVEWDTRALAQHKENDYVLMRRMEEGDEITAAILGKVTENTARIALTITDGATILMPALVWAHRVALHCAESLLYFINREVSENSQERAVKRVLAIIEEARHNGIIQRELTRKTRWLNTQQRKSILDGLREEEQILSYKSGQRIIHYSKHFLPK